ncbi:MAG: hypothetical protein K2K83_01325 [Rikenella sp.]|nr:hypothetical protein [Rikenella sp.]
MWGVGSSGYSWSSAIPAGSTSARNLSFGYDWISPNSRSYRAGGLQLRCLQE